MIYELKDTEKVYSLFEGWEETLIYSCLQKVMGKIYVCEEDPKSAYAYVGCFGFFAGEPNEELVLGIPSGFVIMTPQNEEWSKLIEKCYPEAKKTFRYAIRKDTKFDVDKLKEYIKLLPSGYEIKSIDSELYDKCWENPQTRDFVSSFEDKKRYFEIGRGKVITKNGQIVSGASSYTSYNEGIEIEVDTIKEERRKHLATVACSALILSCLEDGLYPSWDAHNLNSVALSKKLGYEFDHEYTVYEYTKN